VRINIAWEESMRLHGVVCAVVMVTVGVLLRRRHQSCRSWPIGRRDSMAPLEPGHRSVTGPPPTKRTVARGDREGGRTVPPPTVPPNPACDAHERRDVEGLRYECRPWLPLGLPGARSYSHKRCRHKLAPPSQSSPIAWLSPRPVIGARRPRPLSRRRVVAGLCSSRSDARL
jgi:hypothetical protein